MKQRTKWVYGFLYALEGLIYCFRTQKHMKLHGFAALAAVALSFYARLEPGEWLWVLLSIALVWSAELTNTAIERAVDLASPDKHPFAKAAKDAAAAAVLVLSVFALAVGFIILLPHLAERFQF